MSNKTRGDTRRRRVRALLHRDGDRCCYCGGQFGETNLPTIEHIIPRSKGGPNALSNLRLACLPCNNARDDRDISHWRFRKSS